LFPTRLRATGTAFCYNVGRILTVPGFLVKSLLYNTYQRAGFASPFRMAAMTLALVYVVGIVLMPFAPETHDRLPHD
jgi:hypothetical protein